MAKKRELNPAVRQKHNAFVDELFRNGFKKADAYRTVYGEKKEREYEYVLAYKLFNEPDVQEYYGIKMAEYRESLDITKQKMLDRLMQLDSIYEELLQLASLNRDLTENEETRFKRLKSVLSSSDMNKARDMINRMLGFYEAERQEIEHKGLTINYIKPDKKKPEDEDE